MAVNSVRVLRKRTCEIALFTILQKIPEEKGVFSVGVFNSIGSPPTPLRRGAFRLNTMCKNIYIVNSVKEALHLRGMMST
jgi:hypothetical protein